MVILLFLLLPADPSMQSAAPHGNARAPVQIPLATAGQIASGTILMLIAQGLNVPLGIVTNAVLTRTLGPELFGRFVLAGSIVTWFEVVAVRTFGRTSVKLIADADDWRTTASQLQQVQLVLSAAAALLMGLAGPGIAALLGVPGLGIYLRLIAFQIPLTGLVRIHESVLIGRRQFGRRAAVMAAHGVVRLALVVVLLGAGFSLAGALLASVGAAAGQFLIARLLIRIPIRLHRTLRWRALSSYAVPLFLYTITIRLYQNLDITLVQLLGSRPGDTGFYGAAKSLMTMPGMVSVAFSPLLLSVLTGLWQQQDREAVRAIAAQTVRLHLLLLPFIALAAGASHEVITFLYSAAFAPAAPIMAWLVFAGLASMLHSTLTSSLTALDEPGITFWVTVPMLPLLIMTAPVLLSSAGPLGVAIASTLIFTLSSMGAFAALARKSGARFPLTSLLRGGLLAAAAYGLAARSQQFWPTEGPLLLAKLGSFSVLVAGLIVVTREVKVAEIRFILKALHQALPRTKPPLEPASIPRDPFS